MDKLNVDGSYGDNLGSCDGGGIIKDDIGNFKATFSKKFKIGTKNGVEIQALTSGVRLCKHLGF